MPKEPGNLDKKLAEKALETTLDELAESGTRRTQKGDSLEDWRKNKEGTPIGKSYNNEIGDVLTVEESNFEENDPQLNYWKDVEDLGDGATDALLAELGLSDEVGEEIIDEIEKEYVPRMEYEEQEPVEIHETLSYVVGELALMQQCARYVDVKNLSPMVSEKGPRTSSGKKLSKEEVKDWLEKYEDYKNKMNNHVAGWPTMYNKEEIKLMQQCRAWDAFHRRLMKTELPKDANGEVISDINAIEKIAEDYRKFRREKPEEFAKLKHEKGEWKKEYFAWNEKERKGEKEWYCTFNEKEGKVRYFTKNQPFDLYGEYFYVEKDRYKPDGSSITYVEVDLKYPRLRKRIKGKASQEEIASFYKVA